MYTQLLFCFLDSWQFIDQALVTIQWELAEVTRIRGWYRLAFFPQRLHGSSLLRIDFFEAVGWPECMHAPSHILGSLQLH